jgi:hypothetical protein
MAKERIPEVRWPAMADKVVITADSPIPLFYEEERGVFPIPGTYPNPMKVGLGWSIAVLPLGESVGSTIAWVTEYGPVMKTVSYSTVLSKIKGVKDGIYEGTIRVDGQRGTIKVILRKCACRCIA